MCDTMGDFYRDASTTPPKPELERCQNCRFWKFSRYMDGEHPGTPGRCYRHAPAVGGFPAVDAATWCGEWEPRE